MQINTGHILFTVDLEDWFQVENLRQQVSFESWSSRELRVEKNVHVILDLLDYIAEENNHSHAHATFFVLGWLAERIPLLVREIYARGHEVASHGYFHRPCLELSFSELKKDLSDSKSQLEDIIGDRVFGYRAPNFSIDNNVLKTIESCGYTYDSSYNSFSMNRRYGRIDIEKYPREEIAVRIFDAFYELPISNLHWRGGVLPWGGGGYFRLMPLWLFRLGVQSILRKQKAYVFYIHPWEMDPDQPRINTIPFFYRFRHYVNLNRTREKVLCLLNGMKECRFVTCNDYSRIVQGKQNLRKGENGI